jgi:hypothetical protein
VAEQPDTEYGPAFYAIVGKALAEPEFRETLRSEAYRQEELAKIGIRLTADQEIELEKALDAVEALAQQFGMPMAAT